MKKVGKNFLLNLIKGSSILACGGGLPYRVQFREMMELLWQFPQRQVSLLDPGELSGEALFVTAAELGAADAEPVGRKDIGIALSVFEKKIGKKIDGLIPGEIGQEMVIIEAAMRLNLPVVDSDLAGGRAVPRLSDIALVKKNVLFTMSPAIVSRGKGDYRFITKQKSIEKDEEILRKMSSDSKGRAVLFIGGTISGSDIKEYLANRSYLLAARLGKEAKSAEKIDRAIPNKLLLGSREVEIDDVKEIEARGFLKRRVLLKGRKKAFRLIVENEYMILEWSGGRVKFPDLICLLDPQDFVGLSSGQVKCGQKAILVVWERFDCWKRQ